jgi:hypothetical protein
MKNECLVRHRTGITLGLAVVLVLIVLFDFNFAETARLDLYWISYQGVSSADFCCPIHLMQMDEFGNVIRQPKVIIPQGKLGEAQISATALALEGSETIGVWVARRNSRIIRALIDKKTLSLISINPTNAKTTNPERIQVTQRKMDNFLTISTRALDGEVITAFGLRSNGTLNGTRWELSPVYIGNQVQCEFISGCGGGVSSDGKFAFFVTDPPSFRTNLVLQRLDSRGRTMGNAVIAASQNIPIGGIGSIDVTNTLPDGRKFVVYVSKRTASSDNDGPDILSLRYVNPKTGAPLGAPILLKTFTKSQTGQTVAVDPSGRFVVFTVAESGNRQLLMFFQALDATGHPSGSWKLLTENAFSGIDILQD